MSKIADVIMFSALKCIGTSIDPIYELGKEIEVDYDIESSIYENQCNVLRKLAELIEAEKIKESFEDKIEGIYEDAKKNLAEYWHCDKVSCENCGIFDGVNPIEHYDSVSCTKAMMIDLLNRLENLFREKYDVEA